MVLRSPQVVRDNAVDSTMRAVDLSNGRPIWLRLLDMRSGGEDRWLVRCGELMRLRHPALATLVDYGASGDSRCFEAWSCGAAWSGSRDYGERIARSAARFLEAVDLAPGDASLWRVFHGDRGAVAVPPAAANHVDAREQSSVGSRQCESSAETDETWMPGISIVERPAVAALGELLQTVDERSPRVVVLWGPRRCGKTTAVMLLARLARISGFLPVDSCLLDAYRARLAGRSLFVIDDRERDDREAIATWLRAVLCDPRPHVCVLVREQAPRRLDGVALRPLEVDALAAAVRWMPAAQSAVRPVSDVRRLAEQSRGLPGAFVEKLWPFRLSPEQPAGQRVSRVAERPARYGAEAVDRDQEDSAPGGVPGVVANDGGALVRTSSWPAPGELLALRRRVESASALLAEGRHVPGLRMLRQAIGALARRDAWANAGHGTLTLAGELMHRGRPRDALRALDEAREYVAHTRDSGALLDVAALSGEAWIDLARPDEAERVLSAALAAARAAGDAWRASLIATALARSLFWRGAYADAATALDVHAGHVAGVEAGAAPTVRRLRQVARIAIALGDSTQALTALDEARAHTARQTDTALAAAVEHTSAFVRLRLGDLDGVDRDVAACITLGRAARRPVRVLSARLIQAEADRRRGTVQLDPLRRLAAAAPPLVRARWDLLNALVRSSNSAEVISRHAAQTGLRALELFAGATAPSARDAFAGDIVAILDLCHSADDEAAVLNSVCSRVRRQTRAAAVAVVIAQHRRCETVAADGPRIEHDVAERAIQAGITIGPHRLHERLEAAAAVRYGGDTIGALCVRWTPGVPGDLSHVPAVLATAATAVAPVVGALIARRAQAQTPAVADLLGVTPQMVELRRSVECAAAAPFAVLVEGESGSGKELVARAVHRCGSRRDRPFCTLNCAALPDDLVEAELFGHARGSFTGAIADRPGVFEEAHGGTLFLDEVGELSPRAQAKLLRVVQEGEIRRIGENLSRRVDVRLVAATNRDLRREVDAGRFRMDLLYRLDVIRITVPPLRERREDVSLLIDQFWNDAARRVGSRATLASSTRTALTAYEWPGNVRELQNVLAALAVRSPKRGLVPPSALPTHLTSRRTPGEWRLEAARRIFEEGFVRSALVRAGGHRGRAARELGVTRQGLAKLMARLGIES